MAEAWYAWLSNSTMELRRMDACGIDVQGSRSREKTNLIACLMQHQTTGAFHSDKKTVCIKIGLEKLDININLPQSSSQIKSRSPKATVM